MKSIKDTAKLIAQGFEAQNLSNQSPVNCETCLDTGTEVQRDDEGRGWARACACVAEKDRQRRMARRAELIAKIPEEYSGVTLAGLEPRADLHRDQARYIAIMKTNPFDNYYICGDNDTGKTRMLYALYENAVSAGRIVLVATLFDMLDEIKRSFATGRTSATCTIIDNLNTHGLVTQGAGKKVSAFIDDIDKARPTEFAAEAFFSLVDALYRNRHQIIVTSQLDPERRIAGRDSLIDHFEKADARYAVGIVRRLVNDSTHIVRMF